MSNNKKINNGNRYPTNGEVSWAETSQYQQNSPQNRKQLKFYNKNGSNKYHSKNHSYSKPQGENAAIDIQYQNNEFNAVVPVEKQQNSGYAQSIDQSLTEESNLNGNYSPSTNSSSSEKVDEQEQTKSQPQNLYDQGIQTFVPCNGQATDIPQNDLVGNCYNTGYEYDYQTNNVQQQSQYYIYQPYQDYNQIPNVSGSPLNTSLNGTPQHYYQSYQPMPSYIYDPQAGLYASAYSPVQQNSQQNFQQNPVTNGTSLSSPQQQQPSALLAYQTPPQPVHQLYIQTSNITPPKSLSPNDTPSTNSSATANTDRASDCNSPHANQSGVVPSHLTQTPVQNSYVMYSADGSGTVPQNQYPLPAHNSAIYTPITPQTYQCNSPVPLPTPQFMMYNPPPMTQGSPFQTGPNSPMMHYNTTPSNASNLNTPKYNKYRTNRFNGSSQNKRSFNQKYNYAEQTPQSAYSLDESAYMNTPGTVPVQSGYEQNIEYVDQASSDAQMQMYPQNMYCDPNMGMPNTDAIFAAYNNFENIESYGEDYDYDDNGNGDDNDENLACQTCRGRRMCFCYFLKVRYYKFPSFFDLVDHQYKKWRKTMASNNLMQQQQMMNNSNVNLINQSQGMNTSFINNSPNMNTNLSSQVKKA